MKVSINNEGRGHFYASQSGCLTRLMLLSIAVMVGAWLLPGIVVESFGAVLLTALVISILNNILRPILIVITLPATIVTLGFFLFIINAIIILMASEMVNGFHVDNFGSALLFSLVLMGVNYLLELPNKYLNRKNLQQPGNPTFTQTNNDTDDEGFTPYEEVE